MTITHCSDLTEYRNPPGAVRTGDSVFLRLRVEEAEPLSVRLRVFWNDTPRDIVMERAGDFWQAVYTAPEEPGVAWYYFLLELPSAPQEKPQIFYYGAPGNRNQGEGCLYGCHCPSFQLTVFDRDFDTPAWFRGKTMYQIFPDRFRQGDPRNLQRGAAYHRAMGREILLHEHWDEPPLFAPLPGKQHYSPCDFFGGDLRGIIDSLDYFASLGVTTLYLNPIVEAASNHRYDTADYMRVDPILGTNEDFAELCEKAGAVGIRVMIDGVYSHTGSDSRYFNKRGNYDETGAFQGPESPYYKWYTFFPERGDYKSWWGFDTLPEVDEHDESWQEYVITGRESVLRKWLSLGAHGLRLDVADELPDDVIELMRRHWKQDDPQNVLLGEVWEDATTKRSYGVNRRYALGKGLDSVMNYPFKEAVIAFLLGKTNSFGLAEFCTGQSLNYPRPMYHALMNLLSSHDVPRIRSILSTGQDAEGMSREEQAASVISPEEDRLGAKRQRLAAALQFTLPGVPCIYYGDEYGMQGWKDPFNRGTFQQRDDSLLPDYQALARLRQQEAALQEGCASFFVDGDDTLGILRFRAEGNGSAAFLILVNRGKAHPAEIQLDRIRSGMREAERRAWEGYAPVWAEDALTGERYPVRDRRCTLPIGGQDFRIFRLR